MDNIKFEVLLSSIEIYTGKKYTQEQREVVKNFNKSLCVDASPGSGKTTTIVAGLLIAELFHEINPKKINALSYTVNSTGELKLRYREACEACRISPSVNFATFHELCRSIIRAEYKGITFKRKENFQEKLFRFRNYVEEAGLDHEDMNKVKKIFLAINKLDAAMKFDYESVLESAVFKELDVDLEKFQNVRYLWIISSIYTFNIDQTQQPLVALYVLLSNPAISEVFKEKYELMVVDEFQDMSPLYLEVLSLISKNLIVVMDLKQQIYGFNGASTQILDMYKKKFDEALEMSLSQSFRCESSIAEFATKIELPNAIEGTEDFKGVREGGSVTVQNRNTEEITDLISSISNNPIEVNDTMVLARNNASVIPVIEALYNNGIPFRTTKFKRATDLPIIKEMSEFAWLALNPTEPELIRKFVYSLPEFRYNSNSLNPIMQVLKISNSSVDKNILTMRYDYQQASSRKAIEALKAFKEMNDQGLPFRKSGAPLYLLYNELYGKDASWKLDHDPEYYFKLVGSIMDKPFETLYRDEITKETRCAYFEQLNEGVKCYTFHAAKGLEAGTVYLLDLDDSEIMSQKEVDRLEKYGCYMDLADQLRNERNLLYVACTRAKKKLGVYYREALTTLIASPETNRFSYLDKIYSENKRVFDDIKAFKDLYKVGDIL